jgi:hypothetical protein
VDVDEVVGHKREQNLDRHRASGEKARSGARTALLSGRKYAPLGETTDH